MAGAGLGGEFVPTQAGVTDQQGDQITYYVLAEQQGAVVRGGNVVAHNPKVGAAVVLGGIAVFLVGIYGVLYGFWLSVAGYACGMYLGMLLHRSLTEHP